MTPTARGLNNPSSMVESSLRLSGCQFAGGQSGAQCAGELGSVGHHDLPAQAGGQDLHDGGVMGHHAAGGHDHPVQRVHFHDAINHRDEGPTYDAFHGCALPEVGQDLGFGENRAETAQAYWLVRAGGQGIEFGNFQIGDSMER